MADYVQLNYERVLSDGLPGSNADVNPTYDASFIADGDVTYGVVISNASNALRPNMGKVGKQNVAATAGYGIGGSEPADIATLKAVTAGGFKLYVDGTAYSISSVDLSSAATLSAVASALQTKIRAATSGSEVVAVDNGKIKITSGTTGATSSIGPMISPATGTDLVPLLGWTTFESVAGTAAVTAAVMGVVIRNVVDQSSSPTGSNTPVIKDGQLGAYRIDGTIKVMAQEDVTEGSSVYFADATGLLYGSSATGRTQLGSAKWLTSTAAGKVGIIDIRGLR